MRVLDAASGEGWSLFNTDCVEGLKAVPDASIHLAVFSPPFSNLYSYSPSDRDMGNVRGREEFFQHYRFLTEELRRVMIPGRTVAMHTSEIQQYETKDGIRNRYDFPGDMIRHMEAHGFAYRARITINKNAQTQAIRSHPVELLFATLKRDRSKLGAAIADYLLIFTAPGDNPIPISDTTGPNHEQWIEWAMPLWKIADTGEDLELAAAWENIRETAILPAAGSKENDDERHLCPLQLPVIDRLVKLFSNRGETVLDPFGGIGSTGYQALLCDRRALLFELKPSYFKVARGFLQRAEYEAKSGTLFSVQDAEQALSEAAS